MFFIVYYTPFDKDAGQTPPPFFAVFPMECVSGKQGECSHTRHFRLAKMLVGVAPQTRWKPLDTVSRGFPVCGPVASLLGLTRLQRNHLRKPLQQFGKRPP